MFFLKTNLQYNDKRTKKCYTVQECNNMPFLCAVMIMFLEAVRYGSIFRAERLEKNNNFIEP